MANFQDIDEHIESADLSEFAPGGKKHVTASMATANPELVVPRICSIYRTVRPILVALSTFPLIPPKWREALKVFISVMDQLCP